jgi:predicted TIM-barrel fold metal-dependent hydrolase
MTSTTERTPIIDVDSHVVEPRDLWTSRMARKHGDKIPQVVWDENADEHRWKVGDTMLTAETEYATAGWREPFPAHPPTLEEADPACFDPDARLAALDRMGIAAQVLYPNLIGFDSHAFLAELGLEGASEAVRAYNDFLAEFAAKDPNRLIPIAMLPYWDLDEAIAELKRAHAAGHRGVLLAALLKRLGMKNLSDPYWTPLLSVAEDLQVSINLHIGFNLRDREKIERDNARRTKAALAEYTNRLSFVKNMALANSSVVEATADLILGGVCARHPSLKIVSVESGFGYWPYTLDNLDWHWHTSAAVDEFPDRLLPSEYWRQNFFATFWFERSTLPLLAAYQDNVMFETDFPHETGIFPGPWRHNRSAREAAETNLADVDPVVVRKALFDNAARLYGIEEAKG